MAEDTQIPKPSEVADKLKVASALYNECYNEYWAIRNGPCNCTSGDDMCVRCHNLTAAFDRLIDSVRISLWR